MDIKEPELTIDMSNLQEEFCRAAADVGWTHTLAGQAEAAMQAANDELKRTYCKVAEFQRLLMERNGIKPSEARLDEQILKNPDYIAAQQRYVASIELCKVQKGQALAYLKKADMLVSLGALVRAEMNLLPSVRNQ